MKISNSKRFPKRRFKRVAAALAGAAVISSAVLPGIPLTKVHAEADSQQVNAAPAAREEQTSAARTSSPLRAARQQASQYGFDAEHDRFTLLRQTDREATVLVRTEKGKNFRMELSKSGRNDWRVTSVRPAGNDSSPTVSSPVKEVMEHAYRFGFDPNRDTFSLLSLAGTKATVQVRTSGQTFKVDLIKKGNGWEITTIRGIGNSQYPATYIPASMFSYTNLLPKPATTPGQVRTLFETNQFNGWSWLESTYPSDRSFGILLQDPRDTSDLYPANVLSAIQKVDFSKQFVLYTTLGKVSGNGYGIGIEKVVQTGNDYTVTIRTKSPRAGDTNLLPTKGMDFIALDRATLDFSDPIVITFIDSNGTTLSQYTLTLRS